MGLFTSKYQKYKPVYNMWLHVRKMYWNQGKSTDFAEQLAYLQATEFYGLSHQKLLEIVEYGQRKGWGAPRLLDRDLP